METSNVQLSNDPNFESKLIDIVGLYLDPPTNAAVWCFDEKAQCQALDPTQPSLPMIPGRCATLTHDYKRNGTSDLFAVMNIATVKSSTINATPTTVVTCSHSSNGWTHTSLAISRYT